MDSKNGDIGVCKMKAAEHFLLFRPPQEYAPNNRCADMNARWVPSVRRDAWPGHGSDADAGNAGHGPDANADANADDGHDGWWWHAKWWHAKWWHANRARKRQRGGQAASEP